MRKYFFTSTLLSFSTTVIFFWACTCEKPTLVDLQREVLFAKNATDSARVSARLQEYYLNLQVPSPLPDTVASEVAAILDTTNLQQDAIIASVKVEGNVYEAEARLQRGIEKALIARAQKRDQMSAALFENFKPKATRIDSGLGVNYWNDFVSQASRFTAEQAIFWLKAKRAALMCYNRHDKSKLWENGEKYGALGLQYLQNAPDERLRLDLEQRLQVILYDYRGLTDLSFLQAQGTLARAQALSYQLRGLGVLFNYANAKHSAGQDLTADSLFQELFTAIAKNANVPNIAWYRTSGYVRLAYVYWQLGKYREALLTCQKANALEPDTKQKINLFIVRGNVYLRLGQYDSTQATYDAAIQLAHENGDHDNEALARNNIGSMFFNLHEYEKALTFYLQAKAILDSANLDDLSTKILVLCNIAEVYLALNKLERFQQFLHDAKDLLPTIPQPRRKGQFLRTLGKLYAKNRQYQTADSCFANAAAIYEQNGLLRSELENKFYWAECALAQKKFNEATARLLEAAEEGKKLNEPERVIDAYGLLAKIAYEEKHLNQARNLSEQLIVAIESFSQRFSGTERLVLYRNKIDEFLKNAVLYEMQPGQESRAWQKLDYEKGRSLKPSLNKGDSVQYLDLEEVRHKLKTRSIVLDYFITDDSLYVFRLDSADTKPVLLRKPMNRAKLQKKVDDYVALIRGTKAVIDAQAQSEIKAHFKRTVLLAHELYKDLMVWDGLVFPRNRDCKLYLIPEAFLHEVPFSTLVSDTTGGTVRFVVQDAASVQLPSLSFLLSNAATTQRLTMSTAKILMSVDPDFENSYELQAWQEQNANVEVLETSQSPIDKDAVMAALAAKADYDILVFVCHSLSDSLDSDSSYIRVAIRNKNNKHTDIVPITFAELKKLPQLSSRLVLLVGCETAYGKLYHGTGLVGLQFGFLSKGGKCVQASLWRIPTGEAVLQTKALFQRWVKEGLVSIWSLREVQLQYIEEYRNSSRYLFPHPYLWGSYVLITTWYEN